MENGLAGQHGQFALPDAARDCRRGLELAIVPVPLMEANPAKDHRSKKDLVPTIAQVRKNFQLPSVTILALFAQVIGKQIE